MPIINTPIAEIHFDKSQSILHIKVREGAEMNLENTKVHYEKINKLVDGRDYLALVDASNYYIIERDAWKYASQLEVISNRKAVAHYNCLLSNRLITSSFKTNLKTSMPLEIFNSKEEALSWLKQFS